MGQRGGALPCHYIPDTEHRGVHQRSPSLTRHIKGVEVVRLRRCASSFAGVDGLRGCCACGAMPSALGLPRLARADLLATHRSIRKLRDDPSGGLIEGGLRNGGGGTLSDDCGERRVQADDAALAGDGEVCALPCGCGGPRQKRGVEVCADQFHHVVCEGIAPVSIGVEEAAGRIEAARGEGAHVSRAAATLYA